ncbi:MAG: biotin/lipoyl-containing protein [Muribaculaceae bacterium]
MKEYKYKINGNVYKLSVGDIDNNISQVEVNGVPYKVELEEKLATQSIVKSVKPSAAPRTETGAKVIAKPTVSTGQEAVKSPLPGVVIDFKVKVGDAVKSGDTVVILEAMKMENNIHAYKTGVVKSICVNKGDSVLEGTDLIIIE